jgi:uncharacterized membrane protein
MPEKRKRRDQANGDVLDYRIVISTDSYIPYIAGGMVLIIIAGIFVVFRKYGRR